VSVKIRKLQQPPALILVRYGSDTQQREEARYGRIDTARRRKNGEAQQGGKGNRNTKKKKKKEVI